MVKRFPFFALFLVLVGCSSGNQPGQGKNAVEIIQQERTRLVMNHGSGYSLVLPNALYVYGSKKFFSTIPPPKPGHFPIYEQQLGPSDYDVHIFHSSPSPHCSNIGVSKPVVSEDAARGIRTVRGGVDFFKVHGWDYLPEEAPICRPAGGDTGAGYVLCSEKDNKQVLICISQVTDNPTLANAIFSTFRWIK